MQSNLARKIEASFKRRFCYRKDFAYNSPKIDITLGCIRTYVMQPFYFVTLWHESLFVAIAILIHYYNMNILYL